MGFVVISYDISDDGTRTKVANLLLDYGSRVQYSVFELLIDEKKLDELVERLKPFPERGDSIRIYQICAGCLKKGIIIGRGEFEREVSFHIV
ncbi:CRISPR-associated endoribonuclease Cas2 1 [uncultured archaeon]|nr:CRISPR-associated endoribonuclease Cas2 1 [uncultured archaeon]